MLTESGPEVEVGRPGRRRGLALGLSGVHFGSCRRERESGEEEQRVRQKADEERKIVGSAAIGVVYLWIGSRKWKAVGAIAQLKEPSAADKVQQREHNNSDKRDQDGRTQVTR
jgi:hypothetical protein